jgi:phosphatidylserine decarboxylase
MYAFVVFGVVLAEVTAIPLAWKWRLGIGRSALVIGLLALALGALLAGLTPWLPPSVVIQTGLLWLLTVAAALAIMAYRFYRDPERTSPSLSNAIVSPADGEIEYVRTTRAGMLPAARKRGTTHALVELTKTPLHTQDGTVIGIAMNFLDVHVNRAPISGRVSFQCHFPGRFGSLRKPEMVFENERVTTVIEGKDLQIAVVQIASRIVRQIVSFVRVGENVDVGQRIGAIRFGSQVDVVLPRREGIRVVIAPGSRVRAGESVIAVFESSFESANLARAKETTLGALSSDHQTSSLGHDY